MPPLSTERQEELRRWLHSDVHYPSESKGVVSIESMDPVHAFNAYRNLRFQLQHEWEQVARSPLAMALLEQAFDGKIPMALFREEQPSRLTLEDVFDALQELDHLPHAQHPVTRARIIHERLTKENPDEQG